jgi:hypothetical protein
VAVVAVIEQTAELRFPVDLERAAKVIMVGAGLLATSINLLAVAVALV